MKESSELLEEVVVTAQKTKFASEKTGATTNISNTQIASMPSVSRSITDYSRLSAYGGNGMSFAGSDGRTANFTIDGANFNNNFGLSSNLPGGGNPVSIEAIDEIQIVISPFDVRQTNSSVAVSMPLPNQVPILTKVQLIFITRMKTCAVMPLIVKQS